MLCIRGLRVQPSLLKIYDKSFLQHYTQHLSVTQQARKKTDMAGEGEGHDTAQECPQDGMLGWRGVIIQFTDVFCTVRLNTLRQHQSKVTQRGHMICFPL